jgi:hypothetical protein
MNKLPKAPANLRWLKARDEIKRGDFYVRQDSWGLNSAEVGSMDIGSNAGAPYFDASGYVFHYARPIKRRKS